MIILIYFIHASKKRSKIRRHSRQEGSPARRENTRARDKKPRTNKKSHTKQIVKTKIIQQAIPNYSSGQMTGHQYNKDNAVFI